MTDAVDRVIAQWTAERPDLDLAAMATFGRLGRVAAGTTNRIDRLEAAGLVERRLDPDDRRSFLVRLTETGREVADRAVADHVANEERLLAPLSPPERRALDRALRTLLAAVEPDPGA